MEKANGLLWEVSFWEFIFVTVCLAGSAAYLTGRALARSWQSYAELTVNIFLLALATRYIHFALFSGSLLSLHYFIIDFMVLLAIALLGNQLTRSKQMGRQYGFLYERHGFLGWTPRRENSS